MGKKIELNTAGTSLETPVQTAPVSTTTAEQDIDSIYASLRKSVPQTNKEAWEKIENARNIATHTAKNKKFIDPHTFVDELEKLDLKPELKTEFSSLKAKYPAVTAGATPYLPRLNSSIPPELPPIPSSMPPAPPVTNVAKEAEEVAKAGRTWGKWFGEMHTGGKVAIVGGTVALVGTLGLFASKVFMGKHNMQPDAQQTATPSR